ncbi:MAG: prolyl oligopeptidase family serine peptidase [Woeseiaceae bacterium]|nr:prolyl oligopeptidase family serine peptidase [Woeseiaceae bacterium]
MHRFSLLFLTLAIAACGSNTDEDAVDGMSATDADPYLWLEEVEGENALDWVEEQNAESLAYLESLPTFEPLKAQNLENYNSDKRIAGPTIRGDFVYNFWRDATNVRGVWRRMSVENYVAGGDNWQVVLDLDALADAEGEDWVWKGSTCMRPAYKKCLLRLSRGGADAVVVREFDTDTAAFVENGFFLVEAKSRVSWVDEDTLFVGTDFGDGSMTDSGYARTARLWKRGVPIEEAEEVFAGEQTDVAAGIYRTWDLDDAYDIAYRSLTTFTSTRFLYVDGELSKIDIPDDASLYGVFRGQMLVDLKSDWTPGDTTYEQGTLVSIDFADFMRGERDFDVLFEPTETRALKRGGVASTRDYLLLNIMEDVVSKVERLSIVEGEWVGEQVDVEPFGNITFSSADDNSNLFFFYYESFLKPDTLYVSDDAGETITPLQSLPEFFDASGMTVDQYFATSKDGTRVPYFVIVPKDFKANGKTPTLIGAYGGFQVSRNPFYSTTLGHSWLERGGAYVLANIRGGGEYGPAWHQAALKEKRQNAFDDFIAVAEDVIERGISTPQHLGIRGGSNGGLLTGVMLTQRPDLWNGVVVQVPLLDMKRFNKMLAGASWMGEYGDPDTDDWKFIKEYSPYHNIDPDADYPKAFFTTSTRDDRVHPAHARKMVARMKEMGHDLFYFENMVGGHAGASDFTQAARNEALIYSYLWYQLGEGSPPES